MNKKIIISGFLSIFILMGLSIANAITSTPAPDQITIMSINASSVPSGIKAVKLDVQIGNGIVESFTPSSPFAIGRCGDPGTGILTTKTTVCVDIVFPNDITDNAKLGDIAIKTVSGMAPSIIQKVVYVSDNGTQTTIQTNINEPIKQSSTSFQFGSIAVISTGVFVLLVAVMLFLTYRHTIPLGYSLGIILLGLGSLGAVFVYENPQVNILPQTGTATVTAQQVEDQINNDLGISDVVVTMDDIRGGVDSITSDTSLLAQSAINSINNQRLIADQTVQSYKQYLASQNGNVTFQYLGFDVEQTDTYTTYQQYINNVPVINGQIEIDQIGLTPVAINSSTSMIDYVNNSPSLVAADAQSVARSEFTQDNGSSPSQVSNLGVWFYDSSIFGASSPLSTLMYLVEAKNANNDFIYYVNANTGVIIDTIDQSGPGISTSANIDTPVSVEEAASSKAVAVISSVTQSCVNSKLNLTIGFKTTGSPTQFKIFISRNLKFPAANTYTSLTLKNIKTSSRTAPTNFYLGRARMPLLLKTTTYYIKAYEFSTKTYSKTVYYATTTCSGPAKAVISKVEQSCVADKLNLKIYFNTTGRATQFKIYVSTTSTFPAASTYIAVPANTFQYGFVNAPASFRLGVGGPAMPSLNKTTTYHIKAYESSTASYSADFPFKTTTCVVSSNTPPVTNTPHVTNTPPVTGTVPVTNTPPVTEMVTPTEPPATGTPTPTSTPGPTPPAVRVCGYVDVNNDKILNIVDFGQFASVYGFACSDTPISNLNAQCGPKDSNQNGIVDIVDFAYFAAHYVTKMSDCSKT